MVSLELRNQFIEELRSASSTRFAFLLVFNEPCDLTGATTIADRAAKAVATTNRSEFLDVVSELRSRKVKEDADWVLDDFLLFALVVGAKKFQTDCDLCRDVLAARHPTNKFDIAFSVAIQSLVNNAYAIEGEFLSLIHI